MTKADNREIRRTQIVTLRLSGKSWAEIIDFLHKNFNWKPDRRTCQRVMRRYEERGTVEDRPHTGRPPKVNQRESRRIRRTALQNRRFSARELAIDVKKYCSVSLCKQTVLNILCKYGLQRRVAARRPLLTRRMRRQRYEWAKTHSKWSLRRWQRVFFSDEKIFKMMPDRRGVYVTRTKSEKFSPVCLQSTMKHCPQIHVWGAIGWHGVSPLKRVRGNLNGEQYRTDIVYDVKEVGEALISSTGQPIFMQDKAPAHNALLTREFLADRGVQVLDWPGNSPDSNPIENVWSEVSRLTKYEHITNADQLFDAVNAAWSSLNLGYIRSLFRGMPRRTGAVKCARGGSTRY
jgi:transposase